VSATGLQGGSVVNNLDASDKPYRMRGLTRDASKPSAQALAKQGVEVVSCNVSVENETQVQKAFEGASFVSVRAPKRHRIPEDMTNDGAIGCNQLLGAH
jgi:uncharacterized protein YbjT (DUF2867 family)